MTEVKFPDKKIDYTKLVPFGFQKMTDYYLFETSIVDEQFLMTA